ncbi:MAG: hypothetical protein IKZ43_07385 [Acidaminococcaceae bacterium]|nr:hypothetical protein [Acidaminococcaceae bacterium]
MYGLFSRKQIKFLDRVFFCFPAMLKIVQDIRSRKETDAEQSDDPTALTALAGMAPEEIEQWVGVCQAAFAVQDTFTQKVLKGRYIDKESPEDTCFKNHISWSTYWRIRKGFLFYAGVLAREEKIKF